MSLGIQGACRRTIRLNVFLGLIGAISLAAAASANAQIVISQVYGAGGNSGAAARNDYIELFNRGASAVNVTGWSVQYGSSTGIVGQNASFVTALNGTIPAGAYFLVHEASNGAIGTLLPTADATGAIDMSASNGKVALVNNSTPVNVSNPSGASVIDFVGYGTATFFEGAGPASAPSATNATFRRLGGCQDNNNNSADFVVGGPRPRNSSAPLNICGGGLAEAVTDTTGEGSKVDGILSANEYGASNSFRFRGDGNGFGGMVGHNFDQTPSDWGFYLNSDGANLYIGYKPGADLGASDVAVIYLNTKAGGFDDSTMSDTADDSRRTITNLGANGNDTFPAGFLADYAITFNQAGIFPFECTAGSLNFFGSQTTRNGSGTSQNNFREIRIPYSVIGLTPGSNVDFFVALTNGSSGFLSNESIPPSSSLNGSGNPGTSGPGTYTSFDRFTTVAFTPALADTRTDAAPGGATIDGTLGANEYGPANAYVYSGGGTGFGGTVGGGSARVYMNSSATDLFVGFQPGATVNDVVTIYFNTKAGGFTDATMDDGSSSDRTVISELTGDPHDPFPFEADYAVTIWNASPGAFFYELKGIGNTHQFISNAAINGPFAGTSTAFREFSLPLSTLGVSAGGNVDFFVAYCSTSLINSNESIPAYSPLNSLGNPGNGGPTAGYGAYDRFVVENPCTPPSVDSGPTPASQTVCEGDSASIAITASGTGPLSYSWYKGASPLSNGGNISGADTATLTINPVAVGDAATDYNCVVSGQCAPTATSNNATLTVQAKPTPNAGGPYTTCTTTPIVLAGTAANYTSVSWQTSGTGSFTNGNTLTPTYTPSAADVLAGSVSLQLNATPIAPCVTIVSAGAILTIAPMPSITGDAGMSICSTSNASLDYTTTNSGDCAWTTSGSGTFADPSSPQTFYVPSAADITAGGATLTLTCDAVAPCTGTVAKNVSVVIQKAPTANAGGNQAICAGQNVTANGTTSDSASCSWDHNGTGDWDTDPGNLTVTYVPSAGDIANGSVQLTLTCSAIAPCTAAVESVAVITIVGAATANAGGPYATCGTDPVVTASTASNYSAVSWTTPDGTGTFTGPNSIVTTYNPSAADLAAGSITLRLTATGIGPCADAVSDATLTLSAAPTANAGGPYQSCGLAAVGLSGSASNQTTVSWATSGTGTFTNGDSPAASYNPSAADVAAGSVTLTLTANGTPPCAFATSQATLTLLDVPNVTLDPIDATVGIGATVQFMVAATGGGLSYQWYHGVTPLVDGGSISGALSDTLTINPVAPGDAGAYYCVVSNACGSDTSAAAGLTVNNEATLTLTVPPGCHTGDKLVVAISMTGATTTVVGGQYFLEYNPSVLQLVSASPGDPPFTRQIHECSTVEPPPINCVPASGIIDYATGIEDGGTGTSANTVMAYFSFDVLSDVCALTADLVTWRASGPNGALNQLSDPNGDAVTANTVNLGPVKIDTTDPEIACPADTPVDCAGDTTPAGTGAATATDNCGGTVTIGHSDSVAAGSCAGNYVITRTWTATDECGNTASCPQIITVTDTTGPTISCPLDTSVDCDGDTSPTGTGTATATDDCSGVASISHSDSIAAGSCAGNYVITRTWTATDGCGNSSSCDQTITVTDTHGPVVVCPADTAVDCAATTQPAGTGSPTVSDDCSGVASVSFSDVITPGSCAGNYVITRTWSAVDGCGNASNTCNQTITVTDLTGPTISCPADVGVDCAATTQPAGTGTATAVDDCSGVASISFSDAVAAGSCAGNYVITRTWTATDNCGNSSSCDQVITITDSTGPVLTCPADTAVDCAATTQPAGTGTATAVDNCSGVASISFSDAVAAGSCAGNYVITRTWSAIDHCGNASATCDQTITVTDTTGPVVTCPANTTVDCAGDTSPAGTGTATAADDCSGVANITHSDSIATGSCAGNYVITRTWTATDNCGNVGSCDQTITVTDTTGPTITSCPGPNIPVHSAAGGCLSAPVTYSGAATDDCSGVASITFSPPSGTQFPVGTTTVTMTATDGCGNTSQCQFSVTNDGQHEVSVDVELGGGVMDAGSYQRCITFEFWSGATMTYSTSQVYTFTNGNIAPQTLLVPCASGPYTCITARDRLHTLRRTINPIPTPGGVYTAQFVGAKKLIGGNFNDDKFIDILDFGVYTIQDLTAVGANTNCSIVPPTRHADANGDGIVDSIDFGFVATNFLAVRDPNCDGSTTTVVAGDGSNGGPVTRIAVANLAAIGMGDIAPADLTGDGWIDQADITAWQNGVRPTKPAEPKPPTQRPIGGRPGGGFQSTGGSISEAGGVTPGK